VDETGDLAISPLTAEDIPAEAVSLKVELTEMLPFASLLIELDKRTGYLDCLTYASGKQTRTQQCSVQARCRRRTGSGSRSGASRPRPER
jgi:hypothetical protein